MQFNLVPSSPEALAEKKPQPVEKLVYPFNEMQVGVSFAVPFAMVTENALRTAVSRRNKQNDGRTFRVLKHVEQGVYEVARIA